MKSGMYLKRRAAARVLVVALLLATEAGADPKKGEAAL